MHYSTIPTSVLYCIDWFFEKNSNYFHSIYLLLEICTIFRKILFVNIIVDKKSTTLYLYCRIH